MTRMPSLADDFVKSSSASLQLAGSTETLWLTAPKTSQVKKTLGQGSLEALYESAYLRVFGAWENFLEEVVIRLMAGRQTPSYKPTAAPGKRMHNTVSGARVALYNGSNYLLWHDPGRAIKRAQMHLTGSPVETVLQGAQTRLGHFAAIRHRVAHSSDDAQQKYLVAALAVTGQSFGGGPGQLLRGHDISDPLNMKSWIHVLTVEMQGLALHICT